MIKILKKEKAICENCKTSEYEVLIGKGWDFEYATCNDEFQYVECKNCGLFYLTERPARNEMSTIYPENYYSYSESSTQNYIIKIIRDRLERNKISGYRNLLGTGNKLIFDAGCGDGRLLDILNTFCPDSWTFSGIEIDAQAVAKAREKGYKILQGDVEFEELSEFKGQIDLLLMHQVLEHTRSPLAVIDKVKAIIKKGGIISIETPDTDSWDRRIYYKRYWGGYHFPRHFYLFNKKTIRQLLEKTGFEIISIKSLPSPVFWIHSIHNYLIEHHHHKIARYFHYQNPILLAAATAIDMVQIGLIGKSSNMQILAKKIREE